MSVSEFIQKLRAKPVRVRERIAFGAAAAITAVIALIWFAASLTSTGFFAPMLSSSETFERNQKLMASVAAQGYTESSDVVGAAAAASTGNAPEAPHLQIVEVSHSFDDGSATSSTQAAPEQTVIPF
ncbi:MAG TPA: hypothetical protein VF829_03435 [Candidatus Paceibacterota bacterium]